VASASLAIGLIDTDILIVADKGDILNCRGKMLSLRKGDLPGSFNLPRELRMSPLPTCAACLTCFQTSGVRN
jgi:hypothetical protein